MFRRFFGALRGPSKRSLGVVLGGGVLVGMVLLVGYNSVVTYTNTLDFCISCHEMEDTVYQEYRETAHYKNASGVRAVCADCHVPHDGILTFVRKLKASSELYHKVLGTIDTPEKFEARRLHLAEHVWAGMKARDSRECRNCHSWEAMDFTAQDKHSARKMKKGLEEGKTCIDCHKGIAHKLPEGYEDPEG